MNSNETLSFFLQLPFKGLWTDTPDQIHTCTLRIKFTCSNSLLLGLERLLLLQRTWVGSQSPGVSPQFQFQDTRGQHTPLTSKALHTHGTHADRILIRTNLKFL